MSRDLEGLVETSTNLASVKMQGENGVLVTTSQRSSVESRKWDIARQVEALFTLAGAEVNHGDGYPGWAPNMNSRIMPACKRAYEELYGVNPLSRLSTQASSVVSSYRSTRTSTWFRSARHCATCTRPANACIYLPLNASTASSLALSKRLPTFKQQPTPGRSHLRPGRVILYLLF